MLPPQHFKRGETLQRTAALGAIGGEILAAGRAAAVAEIYVGPAQSGELDARNGGIVDQLGLAQTSNIAGNARGMLAVEFVERLDVDVERIEEQPAVR